MRKRVAAFTLIELVLVMALLATLAAIAVPTLARSLRGHNLDGQADRLLALTEYGRDEAASQGIPMVMWIDADGGRFGVDAKPGYGSDTENARARAYTLADDARFDPVGQGMVSSVSAPGTPAGRDKRPAARLRGPTAGLWWRSSSRTARSIPAVCPVFTSWTARVNRWRFRKPPMPTATRL